MAHNSGADLYDYLFATATTLREGLAASSRYLHLLTTHGRLRVEAETARETTYSYSHVCDEECGAELALRRFVSGLCVRARAETGQSVMPVRVGIAQPGTRAGGASGARRIEAGELLLTFTFRARDLDLPMRGANPALAAILRRYAASLPPPPAPSWQ